MAVSERVSLRSRIPEIVQELDPRVGEALYEGAKQIASHAASRAPVATGDLRSSIEAKRGDQNDAQVVAAWYYFFAEFGTATEAPHPFMVPAAEAGRSAVEDEVKAALRRTV